MKRILALSIIALMSLSVHAQGNSTADALKEMNNIKLSGKYIWAEGTSMKNEKEALENAVAVLSYEIQNMLNEVENKNISGVVMPTSDQCMKIQTKRGNLYRAFVYVNKASMVALEKNEKAIVVEKTRDELDKKEAKKKEKENTSQPQSSIEPFYEPNDFEKQILTVKKATDIEAFLKQESIEKYGKYKDRPENGEYYLIVYNREGEIPACLKFDRGNLTNVATGAKDSFHNYKGCGAYWFIYKK